MELIDYDLDLGDNHYLKFYGWFPDRELNPQYKDKPDIEKCGATVWHVKSNGEECMSGVRFDVPGVRGLFPDATIWTVEQWEPLTLSPSLLCRACGDHGFVRGGKWVRA